VFHEPRSLDEAISLLGTAEARPLAGGASLVAMMNARLVEPAALVSLRNIAELDGIALLPGGGVRIGAMTRHRIIAAEPRLSGAYGVLRQAALSIATPPIRNMGTIGGAVAHADPAADYPPALCALGAEIELAGPAGRRRLAARDFFVDWYTTALEAGELIVAVNLPPWPDGSTGFYDKLAKVAGDMAIASVAVVLAMADGRCVRAGLALGGCGPRPVVVPQAEALLAGTTLDATVIAEAGRRMAAACDPVDDTRASAAYRLTVVPRMLARALMQAAGGRA